MQLITFGQLHIATSEFAKTKHLLLLTYLALEGTKKRFELAELFWEGMREELTSKGERKDLQNLSVTLSQIRKQVGKEFIENGQHKGELQTSILCDAKEFLKAFKENDYKQVWELYKGPFLHDVEHIMKFHAFDNLYLWIMSRREHFAKMAQKALLELAKQALASENFDGVGHFAELAHNLPATPPLEPDMLSEINQLLLAGGSRLAAKTSKAVDKFLEDAELSEEALRLFLALSLQDKADFGVARAALKISAKVASSALEELLLAGLVGGGSEVRAPDIAQNYLDENPALRLPLLLDLASATPKEQAFGVYQKIYQQDNTFGGLGYLQKAKAVYLARAWQVAHQQEFKEVTELLKDIREAEVRLGVDPDPEVRFLEAYALERMAHNNEVLALLTDFNVETFPRLLAIKATSLMRLGNQEEAEKHAQTALEQTDDSKEGRWAKALALNCLGNVAYNVGHSEKSISLWKQAGTYWSLLGEKHRQVGVLNNIANVLYRVGSSFEEICGVYNEALKLLDECENNTFQKAHVLINLGATSIEWNKLSEAEGYYLEALNVLKDEELLGAALSQVAILYFNLGEYYAAQNRLESAKSYLRQAMDASLKSGDTITQAYVLAEMAKLKQSPELMQTAIEVFTANNAKSELETYKPVYETILKNQLFKKLSQSQFLAIRNYTAQLRSFYNKQNHKGEGKVKRFLDCTDKMLQTLHKKI